MSRYKKINCRKVTPSFWCAAMPGAQAKFLLQSSFLGAKDTFLVERPFLGKRLNFLAARAKVRGALALYEAFDDSLTDAAGLAGAFVDGGMQGEIRSSFACRVDVVS